MTPAVDKTNANKSEDEMRFFWKMIILSRNYEGSSKPAEEAGWHNTEITTDCKPLTADTTMCTLPMLNHSVITQIHCPILVTNSSGVDTRQFLCQLMIFQVSLKRLKNDCLPGWSQTGKMEKISEWSNIQWW